MYDTGPRTATGKVLWTVTMSLDGFAAGLNHWVDRMTGSTVRPGLIDEIDLHVAPILLGEGIRLCHNPGTAPIRPHRLDDGDPPAVACGSYRPQPRAAVRA